MPKDNIVFYSLADDVNQYLERSAQLRNELAPGYPSTPGPTSASIVVNGKVIGSCLRQVYYRIMGVKGTPANARMLRIWMFGKLFESEAKDIFKSMGMYLYSGVRFYLPDMRIKGELDFIIEHPKHGKFIVENKSFYGYQARKEIFGSSTQEAFPKMENLLQTFIYTYAFREGNQYGFMPLDGAKILYWSRDDAAVKDFDVRCVAHNDDFVPMVDGVIVPHITISGIKARYDQFYECVKTRTLPKRDYYPLPNDEEIKQLYNEGAISKTNYEKYAKSQTDKNRFACASWQCRYCEFYDQCLNDGE